VTKLNYTLFEYIGSFVCHQIPERTLVINGSLLPLCARCTGIYSGFIVGIIFHIITMVKVNKLPSLGIVTISAILILGLITDGLGEYLKLWELSNQGRFLIGLFCGSSISVIFFPLFNFFLRRDTANRNIESEYYIGLFILIILVFCLHYITFSFFLIISVAGLLANYFVFNITISGIVLSWKKREKTFGNMLIQISLPLIF